MISSTEVIILSGGKGTRLEGMDFPKPLCTIAGKSLLYRVLDNLPKEIQKIHLFYSEALEEVQFQRTILHSCSSLKEIQFQSIPIETRGPVETAFVGLHHTKIDEQSPILFIDNDTINSFSLENIRLDRLGLGVFETQDSSKPYCFVKTSTNNRVIQIKEKEGISSEYCTGLYYFPSRKVFIELVHEFFEKFPTKKEYFMSDIYALAIQNDKEVYTFPCEESLALGTKEDIKQNISKLKKYSVRYCFDIDNTLLTYSSNPKTKDGIESIPSMVTLLRRLYNEGNTIVLHTARGMQSNQSNPGLANKKGAYQVLQALEKYDIPYHEIYFGKPWADIYIDDKAWNPYTNPSFQATVMNNNHEKTLLRLEKGCSNNENFLYRKGSILIKEGPRSSLDGEIYFYEMIHGTSLECSCPRFLQKYEISEKTLSFEMDYIVGVPVSKVFRNFLLTKNILSSICRTLEKVHTFYIEKDNTISKELILSNYIDKLKERVQSHKHYILPEIKKVTSIIEERLTNYIQSDTFKITNVVHGDPWFDNMILTSSQEIKLLDMKGKLGSTFTLKGDKMTDYAKLYQSILGFDFYLHGQEYPVEYEGRCFSWLSETLPFPIDDPIFEAVTACMVLKTFYYFSNSVSIPLIYTSLGKLKLFSFLRNV